MAIHFYEALSSWAVWTFSLMTFLISSTEIFNFKKTLTKSLQKHIFSLNVIVFGSWVQRISTLGTSTAHLCSLQSCEVLPSQCLVSYSEDVILVTRSCYLIHLCQGCPNQCVSIPIVLLSEFTSINQQYIIWCLWHHGRRGREEWHPTGGQNVAALPDQLSFHPSLRGFQGTAVQTGCIQATWQGPSELHCSGLCKQNF